jgi:hypothetical protein
VSAWPWRTLGIKPTSDRKAIRSAYAAKLKSGEFEEADAFARLRAARDEALALADGGALPVEQAVEHVDDTPAAVADGLSLTPPVLAHDGAGIAAAPIAPADAAPLLSEGFAADHGAGETVPIPEASLSPPRVAGHAEVATIGQRALLSNLQSLCHEIYHALEFGTPDELLDAEAAAALRGTLQQAIHLAGSESIDQQADFEIWLAELIARTLPRSDPILDIASEAYDWAERGKLVDAPPVIAWLGQRRAAASFIAKLENPQHRWHRAYAELTKPADASSKRGRWVRGGNVRDLLKYVRANHPAVEQSMDPWRVELWEEAPQGKGGGWGGLITVVVIVLINIARVFGDHGSTSGQTPVQVPAAPVQITSPLADSAEIAIAPAMLLTGGQGWSAHELKTKNPALFADLEYLWEVVRGANGSAEDFTQQASGMLRMRSKQAMASASYALSRDRIRLTRKVAQSLRANSPRNCAAFLGVRTGFDEMLLNPFADDYRELLVRSLTERSTPETLPKPGGNFKIPGDVVEDTIRRSHVSLETARAVFQNKDLNDERVCSVLIALMDSALAASPKEGLPLLRSL